MLNTLHKLLILSINGLKASLFTSSHALTRCNLQLLLTAFDSIDIALPNTFFFFTLQTIHDSRSHLKLSQVPHFQSSVIPTRQEEWFAPIPADHVHVRWVSLIGRKHWIGRGTDVPDTDGLIHRTRCKNLQQTRTQREIGTRDQKM